MEKLKEITLEHLATISFLGISAAVVVLMQQMGW